MKNPLVDTGPTGSERAGGSAQPSTSVQATASQSTGYGFFPIQPRPASRQLQVFIKKLDENRDDDDTSSQDPKSPNKNLRSDNDEECASFEVPGITSGKVRITWNRLFVIAAAIVLGMVILHALYVVLLSFSGGNRAGSCAVYKCGVYTPGQACRCDRYCEKYGNCCYDYNSVCFSCQSYGCGNQGINQSCQCTGSCKAFNTCCSDFDDVCANDNATRDLKRQSVPLGVDVPTLTFYMYRAQNADNYPPLNVNMADLGGVLWYLNNEVVDVCNDNRGYGESGTFGYRRFRIERILRYKVSMKATPELYKAGMNFGVRLAFDKGKCTGAYNGPYDCPREWKHYGFVVGCNKLGLPPYPACPPYGDNKEGFCPITYPGAWYNFPKKGYCDRPPTGEPNCTWTYEPAGEVNIDELVGITPKWKSHQDFCQQGCIEYRKYGYKLHHGICIDWWDFKEDPKRNKRRMELTDKMFMEKYHFLPGNDDLLAKCDFDSHAYYGHLEQSHTWKKMGYDD